MIDTELEDILTVLAIGVYADKRIFASEIQVFTQSVSGIELSKRENSKVSGAQALLWFEMHKDEIREKFDGPRSEFDAWIIPILYRVSEHGNIDELIGLLDTISLADDEFHISEKAFIVLAKKVWGRNKASELSYLSL